MKNAMSEAAPTEEARLLDELKQKESISSDAKLATLLGVSRGYICSVRKGRKRLSLELAKGIFSRLGRTYVVEDLEGLLLPVKVRRHTSNLKEVRNYVIKRAGGNCQLCGNHAPFDTPDGLPFLEVHHVVPFRDGGSDAPDNLVALCPNCNRKIEHAPTSVEIEKLGRLIKKYRDDQVGSSAVNSEG